MVDVLKNRPVLEHASNLGIPSFIYDSVAVVMKTAEEFLVKI